MLIYNNADYSDDYTDLCLYFFNTQNYPSDKFCNDNIEYVFRATKFHLFIKLKTGEKLMYNPENNNIRFVNYKSEMLTHEEAKEEFGHRLKSFLYISGLDQNTVAERIGTSQVMISRYANGQTLPNINVINKLAFAFHVNIADFFYREKPEGEYVYDYKKYFGRKYNYA